MEPIHFSQIEVILLIPKFKLKTFLQSKSIFSSLNRKKYSPQIFQGKKMQMKYVLKLTQRWKTFPINRFNSIVRPKGKRTKTKLKMSSENCGNLTNYLIFKIHHSAKQPFWKSFKTFSCMFSCKRSTW